MAGRLVLEASGGLVTCPLEWGAMRRRSLPHPRRAASES